MCDFIPSVACGYSWIKKNHSYCSKKEEYSTLHRPIRKNALCLIKKKNKLKNNVKFVALFFNYITFFSRSPNMKLPDSKVNLVKITVIVLPLNK